MRRVYLGETASGWTRIAGREHAVRRAPSHRGTRTEALAQALAAARHDADAAAGDQAAADDAPRAAGRRQPGDRREPGPRGGRAGGRPDRRPRPRRPRPSSGERGAGGGAQDRAGATAGRARGGRRPATRPTRARAPIAEAARSDRRRRHGRSVGDPDRDHRGVLRGRSTSRRTSATTSTALATAPRMTEEGEEFSLENRAEAPPGLDAHLTEQLGVSDATGVVREACGFMIGNVDADGYLRVTLAGGLRRRSRARAGGGRRPSTLLQSFDPVGVGGPRPRRSASSSRRAAAGRRDAAPRRARHAPLRRPRLRRRSGAPGAADERPASRSSSRRSRGSGGSTRSPGAGTTPRGRSTSSPTSQVVKVDDDYVVLFNDDGLPRLKVSAFYRRLLASTRRARSTARGGATFARRCAPPSGS